MRTGNGLITTQKYSQISGAILFALVASQRVLDGIRTSARDGVNDRPSERSPELRRVSRGGEPPTRAA